MSEKTEIYIDDTPSDFSNALEFNSEEEENAYWDRQKIEIEEASKKEMQ